MSRGLRVEGRGMGTWSSSLSNSANSFIMERRAVASSLLPAKPHHRTRYCQTKRSTHITLTELPSDITSLLYNEGNSVLNSVFDQHVISFNII